MGLEEGPSRAGYDGNDVTPSGRDCGNVGIELGASLELPLDRFAGRRCAIEALAAKDEDRIIVDKPGPANLGLARRWLHEPEDTRRFRRTTMPSSIRSSA